MDMVMVVSVLIGVIVQHICQGGSHFFQGVVFYFFHAYVNYRKVTKYKSVIYLLIDQNTDPSPILTLFQRELHDYCLRRVKPSQPLEIFVHACPFPLLCPCLGDRCNPREQALVAELVSQCLLSDEIIVHDQSFYYLCNVPHNEDRIAEIVSVSMPGFAPLIHKSVTVAVFFAVYVSVVEFDRVCDSGFFRCCFHVSVSDCVHS